MVSNHADLLSTELAAPSDMLPSVTDAVGGKAPILIDDSFRRGADVLKALALGARAVLDRPSCSLASSDTAEGVQTVLGMLQSEFA